MLRYLQWYNSSVYTSIHASPPWINPSCFLSCRVLSSILSIFRLLPLYIYKRFSFLLLLYSISFAANVYTFCSCVSVFPSYNSSVAYAEMCVVDRATYQLEVQWRKIQRANFPPPFFFFFFFSFVLSFSLSSLNQANTRENSSPPSLFPSLLSS